MKWNPKGLVAAMLGEGVKAILYAQGSGNSLSLITGTAVTAAINGISAKQGSPEDHFTDTLERIIRAALISPGFEIEASKIDEIVTDFSKYDFSVSILSSNECDEMIQKAVREILIRHDVYGESISENLIIEFVNVIITRMNNEIRRDKALLDYATYMHVRIIQQNTDIALRKIEDISDQLEQKDVFNKNHDVKIFIKVPELQFEVKYYIIHVRDGKDEMFLDRTENLKNHQIEMKPSPDNTNMYDATITTRGNIGFQFKCFAKCDPMNLDELISALSKLYGGKSHYQGTKGIYPSVKKGTYNDFVWFILPNYRTCETCDFNHSFLNNYYDHINEKNE